MADKSDNSKNFDISANALPLGRRIPDRVVPKEEIDQEDGSPVEITPENIRLQRCLPESLMGFVEPVSLWQPIDSDQCIISTLQLVNRDPESEEEQSRSQSNFWRSQRNSLQLTNFLSYFENTTAGDGDHNDSEVVIEDGKTMLYAYHIVNIIKNYVYIVHVLILNFFFAIFINFRNSLPTINKADGQTLGGDKNSPPERNGKTTESLPVQSEIP